MKLLMIAEGNRSLVTNLPALVIVTLALRILSGCDSASSTPLASQTSSSALPLLVHQADGQEALAIDPTRIAGLSVGTVQEIPLPGLLETVGQVTFDDRLVSTIISRVSGRLEDIRVSQWDTVRAGEPILSIYSPDFMTAEAEYLQAPAMPKQTPELGEPTDAFGMMANLKAAAVRKLELLGLSLTDIAAIKEATAVRWMRAPISGIVVTKLALRGAQVNPGDQLFALATLQRIWITADIYEDDLARVHAGQRLEAVTAAYPGEVFEGVINQISPALNSNTHTLQLRCELPNPGDKLKPQMLARVHVATRPGSALVVPQEALVFDDDNYYAFVETVPNRIERHTVTIMSWNEHGYARVTSGLKPGQRVVVRKSLQLNTLWRTAHGESS
jgi:membrane fusion protein, copper/silver efflux system